VLLTLANILLVQYHVLLFQSRAAMVKTRGKDVEPLRERLPDQWSIVHHVSDLLPLLRVNILRPFDDADGLLEVVARRPELAVECDVIGEKLFEPVWRAEEFSSSAVHVRTIPVAADAIKLLRHQPALRIMLLLLPLLCELHGDGATGFETFGLLQNWALTFARGGRIFSLDFGWNRLSYVICLLAL